MMTRQISILAILIISLLYRASDLQAQEGGIKPEPDQQVIVLLANGTEYKGRVIAYKSGDYLRIRLVDGTEKFIYASDIKMISNDIPRKVNQDGIEEYMHNGVLVRDSSAYKAANTPNNKFSFMAGADIGSFYVLKDLEVWQDGFTKGGGQRPIISIFNGDIGFNFQGLAAWNLSPSTSVGLLMNYGSGTAITDKGDADLSFYSAAFTLMLPYARGSVFGYGSKSILRFAAGYNLRTVNAQQYIPATGFYEPYNKSFSGAYLSFYQDHQFNKLPLCMSWGVSLLAPEMIFSLHVGVRITNVF